MKRISFALTTPQFRARTKRVTRRTRWLKAKAGDHVMGRERHGAEEPDVSVRGDIRFGA